MTDAKLRAGERSRDPAEHARVLAIKLRAGHIRENEVKLAAWLGHPAARAVFGDFDARPEWWEDMHLEYWVAEAGKHAGFRKTANPDRGAEQSPRSRSFHLLALVCCTGYMLGRMAVMDLMVQEERDTGLHEDPEGWRTHISFDFRAPSLDVLQDRLHSLGYLSDDVLHAINDIHMRALEGLHPDYPPESEWAWDVPDWWFGGNAIDENGEIYRSPVGCGTFGWVPTRMSPDVAAVYFAADVDRLDGFRGPVRERLRANLCYWAIGDYTPRSKEVDNTVPTP